MVTRRIEPHEMAIEAERGGVLIIGNRKLTDAFDCGSYLAAIIVLTDSSSIRISIATVRSCVALVLVMDMMIYDDI